jgi:hypothetical protein
MRDSMRTESREPRSGLASEWATGRRGDEAPLFSPLRPLALSPARLLIIIVCLLALAACGGSGITQTTQTTSYQVKLSLDGTSFGEHMATIEVSDRSGQPVAADQVVLAPVMESMGMAAPEQVAQSVGPGRYQVQGEFFSMIGEWEVDVRVSTGGKEEVARFKVPVSQ